jgi:hypothetical protein
MGDKFSALLLTTLAFQSGNRVIRCLQGKTVASNAARKLSYFHYAIALTILCLVPIVGYARYHNVERNDMLANVVSRIAIDQGAVWHATYKLVKNTGETKRLDVILGQDSMDHPSGINALMFALADYSFAYNSREAGISFAMGYPAIVIYVFGLIGGMPVSLLGALLVAACTLAILIFIRTNLVGWLFLAINSLYILQDILLMGRTWKLAGWQMGPLLLCIFMVAVLHSKRSDSGTIIQS